MIATLLAIVAAALILPGILAARSFYQSGRTNEVEPSVPALSSVEGIGLVGAFSVAVHLLYSLILWLIADWRPVVDLPLANPYAVIAVSPGATIAAPQTVLAFFLGLGWLCLLAFAVGRAIGWTMMRHDRIIFYGPLTDIISAGQGGQRFITAYVLTKVGEDDAVIGYQGMVTSLVRDGDQYPVKVTLKDASIFRLSPSGDDKTTQVTGSIDWIVLTSEEWHNIAFRVFELESDASPTAGEVVLTSLPNEPRN